MTTPNPAYMPEYNQWLILAEHALTSERDALERAVGDAEHDLQKAKAALAAWDLEHDADPE